MHDAPSDRWDLQDVQSFLEVAEHTTAAADTGVLKGADAEPDGRQLPLCDLQRLVDGGLAQLLVSMNPGDQGRLWPSNCFGQTTDPCNVYDGAAGVIPLLTLAARHEGDTRLLEALRAACEWIERRLPAEPRLLPGLYFGRSGTAWALYEAAQVLKDEEMGARALELAKRLPVTWPNPDVTHGAAGAGLAQLHLWEATGDPELGQRVQRCANGLVAAAVHERSGIGWPIPGSFDSRLAGNTYYGFAHGVAGIGWFLLAVGLATDRDDCLTLARAAGETLCASAQLDEHGATWGGGPHDEESRMVHWCHGSSGVGTFLIRLWQATGEEHVRVLAEKAAVAVRRGRWQAPPGFCHGLAGDGEYLLDLAQMLDEPSYRAWAEELAAIIFARRADREGRAVVPDETGMDVTANFGLGLAGVVAFLWRLCHGGPRMWMADRVAVKGAAP
ncbi:MAG: lanthionine synthetase LanC family protein [Egibacteraceae bacterium]